MEAVKKVEGKALPLGLGRRGHRPDRPERRSQAHRADRLRTVPVLQLARRPGLHPQQARARGRGRPHRRPELRLWFQPRARALGHPGLRLRSRHSPVLRRHLQEQLRQDRSSGRRAAGRRRTEAPGDRPRRPGGAGSPWTSKARTVKAPGIEEPFTFDNFARYRLLNGLDDIALTLTHEGDLEAYEKSRPSYLPSVS